MTQTMSARERISKSMIALMDKMPFYAELLMRASIVEVKRDEPCKYQNWRRTMGVNITGDILYDAEFVESLSDGELNFIMLHEAKHKTNLHVVRGARMQDQMRWGLAIDIVVDWQLKHRDIPAVCGLQAEAPKDRIIADGYGVIEFTVPDGLREKKIRLTGIDVKSAEEVYAELPPMPNPPSPFGMQGDVKEKGQGKTGLGKGDSHHNETGDGTSFKDMDELAQDQLEEQQKDEIVEAATKCMKRGKLPADVQRLLEQVLKGKVDWRRYLWKHIIAEMPHDIAWRRPSRRFMGQGIMLPGMIKENLDVVVLIDLSGSIDGAQKDEFVAECIGIAEMLPNVNMTIVAHDSKVCAVTEVTEANKQKILRAHYRGGGGTDHRPCFEWVEKNKPNARVVVAFTDGMTIFPNQAPKRETLWVLSEQSVEEVKIPFGRVIKMSKRR